MRTLFLLDVDGVLIHAEGYKFALQATVNRFATQMGQPQIMPSDDDRSIFEACGLTNEWDSGAMCVSMIMLAALEQRPDLRRSTLDETMAAIRNADLTLPQPDFAAAAREIHQHYADDFLPAMNYLKLLSARTDAANLPLLTVLLGNVYDVLNAPTTRTFQTYTLGHARFAITYDQPAPFEHASYLLTHDIPMLNAANKEQLLRWHAASEHGAVIFTARPSLPPADLDSSPVTAPTALQSAGYAPEAELAVELLGLENKLPLIGQGRVSWLAAQNGRGVADYIKPSPVQGLAAIGAALSGTETEALHAAAALVEQKKLTGPLTTLRNGATHVVVFEDSTGGIRAAQKAVDHLTRAGLELTFEAIGMSWHPDKCAALTPVADHVVDDINAGLLLVWDKLGR